MKFKTWTLGVIFLFVFKNITAQTDNSRIKKFEDKLLIGLYLSDNNASTYFTNPSNQTILQIPALKPSLGVQFAYNGLVLAGSIAVPIPKESYEYDASKILNISGYLVRAKVVVWGAIRHYKGFVYEPINQSSIKNATFTNVAASYMYIFNPEKYGYRAAFRQSEQQTKQGGSWLVKGGISYTNVYDSSLTILTNQDFVGFSAQGLGVLLGYGYTFNLTERFFLSALALGGIDFQYGDTNIKPAMTTPNLSFNSFAPAFDFKSSIGYNSDKFYIAFLYDFNNWWTIQNIKTIDVIHQHIKADIRVGIRIDAPQFLTKVKFLN